jgi:hypothetical protein
MLQPVI